MTNQARVPGSPPLGGTAFAQQEGGTRPPPSHAFKLRDDILPLAATLATLGLWEFEPASGALAGNGTLNRLHGLPADHDARTEDLLARIHPEDRGRVEAALAALEHDHEVARLDIEYRVLRQDDGALRWLRASGAPLAGSGPGFRHFVGITLDVTDGKLAEQQLRVVWQRDPLTGLPGRGLLYEYCSHLLAMAHRTHSSGAMLFIDLDRFKPINDTHGHGVGDLVLQQVAKRLLACVRQEDIVGRLGGDEFVVAIPHPDDRYGPATVAKHIIRSLGEPFHVANLQLHLSASIGISLYPRHGSDLDSLLKAADHAMYMAKQGGSNRYRFFNPIDEGSEDRDMQIESLLRQALDNDGLQLLYQPVIDMQTGMTVCVEALLRLPLAVGEVLAPDAFLPVAESSGLINRLGDWVLSEVGRQHAHWCLAGLPGMPICVNIAPQQFRQRGFVGHLMDSLNRSGMDPRFLQIELKESTVLEGVPDSVAALRQIRQFGVQVALDDFGSGFSSIGLLSSLPVDTLKIDQVFVQSIAQDPQSRAIADTVLALGRSLRLKVVGEGIESEAVFSYLHDRGCNQAQGYYFSKPLSAGEFEQWRRQEQSHAESVH
ncbi:putative bifunctional diguanylate cyclase/phosphodiesterase [Lacisediminimonas profundi]|uniref:putative bifunctional diguanylate cyclase/phosphodiesterase n=1 Tax=Lacisediminimonas profundi TaxID=2603856 RepID=UPI001386CB3F|nr:GGDEF domain-containing phosphodiesterase [Lacisediminimonas profundi]